MMAGHLATYVGLIDHSEKILAEAYRTIADGHANAPDVHLTCLALATMCDDHRDLLRPVVARYGEQDTGEPVAEPETLHAVGVAQARVGQIGLLRDLQDLQLLATFAHTTWTVIAQAAQGLRDHELLDITRTGTTDITRQLSWLTTRIKAAAPQPLIIG